MGRSRGLMIQTWRAYQLQPYQWLSWETKGGGGLGLLALMLSQLSKLVSIRDAYAYPKHVASTVVSVTFLRDEIADC